MPVREHYLGIDLGTTALKAALFDARSGRLVAGDGQRLDTRVIAGGRREQRAEALLAALWKVLTRLRRKSQTRWSSVAGVGFASQGGSAVIADSRSGMARTPLWLWNDSGPLPYMPQVMELLGRSFWRRRTMRDEPGAGLGRMLLLKNTNPRLLSGDSIYAGAGEYVYFHLTGKWRQDAGSALQVGCYDSRRGTLMAEPLEAVGAGGDFVAPMREGHTTFPLSTGAARELGLPAGTPVAGPYMDHEAGFMAACRISRRPLVCSLGTAWVGNFVMPTGTKWTSPFQLVIPSPVGPGSLVIQPLLTGNVSWEWGLAAFAHEDRRKALAHARGIFARSMWPAGGLTAIPWLTRPNPLVAGRFGAGLFQGIEPGTTADDMLRSLAAGMVFEFYRIFEEIHRKRLVDSVVLGGGAASGAFFRAALASLFGGLPAYSLVDGDWAGSRGALRPFGLSGAQARRIKVASEGVARETLRRYREYLKVFEAAYGDVSLAAPIRTGKT